MAAGRRVDSLGAFVEFGLKSLALLGLAALLTEFNRRILGKTLHNQLKSNTML